MSRLELAVLESKNELERVRKNFKGKAKCAKLFRYSSLILFAAVFVVATTLFFVSQNEQERLRAVAATVLSVLAMFLVLFVYELARLYLEIGIRASVTNLVFDGITRLARAEHCDQMELKVAERKKVAYKAFFTKILQQCILGNNKTIPANG